MVLGCEELPRTKNFEEIVYNTVKIFNFEKTAYFINKKKIIIIC